MQAPGNFTPDFGEKSGYWKLSKTENLSRHMAEAAEICSCTLTCSSLPPPALAGQEQGATHVRYFLRSPLAVAIFCLQALPWVIEPRM